MPRTGLRALLRVAAFVTVAAIAAGVHAQQPAPDPNAPGQPELRALAEFDILGTKAGYIPSAEFIKFTEDTTAGIKEKDLFAGRGPLAILLIVLRRRSRAEPHAVRAADDPDQPGDHRRRHAGVVTPARLPARLRLRPRHGAGLRRARPGRDRSPPSTFGTVNSSPWFNLAIALLFVVLALAMFDVLTIDFSHLMSRCASARQDRARS